jgi:hypothetical protein
VGTATLYRHFPLRSDLITAVFGAIRDGVDPLDLLGAVAKLCIPPTGTDDTSRADRMIAMLIDGLRYRASPVPVRRAEAERSSHGPR